MKVVNLKAAKAAKERKSYADLVLREFNAQTHDSKRTQHEQRAAVQRKARNNL